MDLKEIGINTRNWIDPAQGRDYWRALVNAALNLRQNGVTFLQMRSVGSHSTSGGSSKEIRK